MHTGPSEASLLQELLKKEVAENAFRKEQLEQIQERAKALLENDDASSGDYIKFVQSLTESTG